MNYEDFKEKFNIHLNEQQKRALDYIDGQTLMLAVPGSGKTYTLICRIGYMVYVKGVSPDSILVVTFTRAAADDMRKRFAIIFGMEYSTSIRFCTIHSFCYHTIVNFCKKYNLTQPSILENNVPNIVRIYTSLTSNYPTDKDISNIQLEITRTKNGMLSQQEIEKIKLPDESISFSKIYSAYIDDLKLKNQIDYDDQLRYTVKIFSQYPEVLAQYQDHYRYFLVDEAQDTSKIQHEIIRMLVEKNKRIFMVGDEDQTIYGFRAAYPQALYDFNKVYPNAQILKLERNYRSTKVIVNVANTFIKQIKDRYDKNMFTTKEGDNGILAKEYPSRDKQFDDLVKNIMPAFAKKGNIALMYRNNTSAIPVISKMITRGIDFQCRGIDTIFFSNKVIKGLKDLMLSALSPFNRNLFWETYFLFNGTGKKTNISKKHAALASNMFNKKEHDSYWDALSCCEEVNEKAREFASEIDKVLLKIRSNDNALKSIELICNAGYKYADDDIVFIARSLAEKDDTIKSYFDSLDVLKEKIANIDLKHNSKSPYILSTVHGSKGLEYDSVIIMDAILPMFPDQRVEIDEERRLFYVAMTRAKNNLLLLKYKDEKQPFIDAVENILVYENSKIEVGTIIKHQSYGKGTIVEISKDNKTMIVEFSPNDIRALDVGICFKNKIVKVIKRATK